MTEPKRLPKKLRGTLPPYSRTPVTLPDGTPVVLWNGPGTPLRCECGRPVPASSLDGINCGEHDSEVTE